VGRHWARTRKGSAPDTVPALLPTTDLSFVIAWQPDIPGVQFTWSGEELDPETPVTFEAGINYPDNYTGIIQGTESVTANVYDTEWDLSGYEGRPLWVWSQLPGEDKHWYGPFTLYPS
jgi:hypothetical protein